jgi:spore maturation protein CgeB
VKILLVAAQSSEVLGAISGHCAKALKSLNHEIEIFNYRQSQYLKTPAGSFLKSRIKSHLGFSPRKIPFFNSLINSLDKRRINKALLEITSEWKPDILLVLKGESIFPETLLKIRNHYGVITANWFTDTVVSPYWKDLAESISSYYDYFFMIDNKEVLEEVKIKSSRVECLPLGCDPDIHKSMKLTGGGIKEYGSDICFVGTVVPNRETILEAMTDFDLSIWGPSANIFGPWLKENSGLKKRYRGREVHGEEVVKVYNASKIILGIHGLYGSRLFSVTPRLFEATGCGAFYLVNEQPQIYDLYNVGEEVICYKDAKELTKLVEFYLQHPKERNLIAKKGQQRAYSEHTYLHRMKKLIFTIERSK